MGRDGKNPGPFWCPTDIVKLVSFVVILFYYCLWYWTLNPGPYASKLANILPLNCILCPWFNETGSHSLPQLNLPCIPSTSIISMCHHIPSQDNVTSSAANSLGILRLTDLDLSVCMSLPFKISKRSLCWSHIYYGQRPLFCNL